MLNNYKINKLIGSGTFGDVYKGYDNKNSRDIAIKKISIFKFKKANINIILNEIKIGYFHNCDYLVKVEDFFIEDNNVYIIMAFYNDIDCKKFLKTKDISKIDINSLLLRILLGIQYLHINKVIHRDLKITNIMVGDSKTFIGDFGTCYILSENKYFTSTCIGTPYYLSPEIIEGEKYNTKIDIYSLGCLLCEIYYNKLPYTGKNVYSLYKNILDNNRNFDINNKTYIGNLVENMIDKNPFNRPLIKDIISNFCTKNNLKYKLYRKDNSFYEEIRKDFGKFENIDDLKLVFQNIKDYKINK